jgi:hypothetical protein
MSARGSRSQRAAGRPLAVARVAAAAALLLRVCVLTPQRYRRGIGSTHASRASRCVSGITTRRSAVHA